MPGFTQATLALDCNSIANLPISVPISVLSIRIFLIPGASSSTFQEVLPTVQYISFDEGTDTCSYDIEWPSLRFDDLRDPGYSITLINSARNVEKNETLPKSAGRGDAKVRIDTNVFDKCLRSSRISHS